jgi:CubicO group peptidase (beta-lactamase class C family)
MNYRILSVSHVRTARILAGIVCPLVMVSMESSSANPVRSETETAVHPAEPVGRWAGAGLQVDWLGNPLAVPRIALEFNADGAATISYPSLGCAGTLTRLNYSGDSIVYRETLTTGADKCLSGGVVTLRASGDRWIYGWTLNDGWLKPDGLSSQPLPPQPGAAPNGDLVRTAVLASVPNPKAGDFVPRDAGTEERIARIRSGIVPPVLVAGETPQKLTLSDLMKQLHVPGVSIAVIHHGQIDWARGYGVAGIGGAPVNPDTLFQAASISKPVTALIALRLAQARKFDLDVDANTYLKSWKIPPSEYDADRPVTARGLLTHSAGIGVDGFAGYAAGQPTPTLVQILNGEGPANSPPIRVEAEPGTRWNYSGGGYVILRQLLEDVSGKPFADLAQETVLLPLGMTHSTFAQPLPATANAAIPYDGGGNPIGGGAHTYPELAPDGLWTTPTDLARFALEIQRALKGEAGTVLSQAAQREMLAPGEFGGWGMGVATGGTPARRYFWHSGSNAGFKSMLFAYNEGEGAVVMTNSDSGEKLASNLVRTIAYEYGWPNFQPDELQAIALPPHLLDSLRGAYRLGRYSVLTISRQGNALFVAMSGQPAFRIYPTSAMQWFAIDPDGFNPAPNVQIAFQKTASRLSGLVLRQDQVDAIAPRISETQVEEIAKALAERVTSQKQTPGSDRVLRNYMDALVSDRPDYTHMGPAAARITRMIIAYLATDIRQLGTVRQVTFKGVSPAGGDMFAVQFEHAAVNVEILCDSNGMIENVLPALR